MAPSARDRGVAVVVIIVQHRREAGAPDLPRLLRLVLLLLLLLLHLLLLLQGWLLLLVAERPQFLAVEHVLHLRTTTTTPLLTQPFCLGDSCPQTPAIRPRIPPWNIALTAAQHRRCIGPRATCSIAQLRLPRWA